jgi:hypothetical protein
MTTRSACQQGKSAPATGVHRAPGDAASLSIGCGGALEGEGLSPFGSESSVPVLPVPFHELKQLALDNVAGFLLSLMDGVTDVETILDISNLPRPVTRDHLRSLLERGIIVLRLGGELPVAPGLCGDRGVAPGDDVPPSPCDLLALRRI